MSVVARVSGKNASLGERVREPTTRGPRAGRLRDLLRRLPGPRHGQRDRPAPAGAARGARHGPKVRMVGESPADVVLAEQSAERCDGLSIGSDDLTQLVLGVDRDAGALRALFDERDEAVTRMISEAIRKAHAAGIPIGICGQGPGNHPDFAEFLVREGIDSVSLNPDSFLRTVRRIAETEQRIGHEPARERRRTMES
ncbi:putative PEP-binding protein [Kocuria oceani]|uniref:PEP-binding protein n=1 Tax=Kocuria oceani TaxID=988827 RepID=A0ABV9TMU8_9MICC